MGYNTTIGPVQRWRETLDKLMTGQRTHLTTSQPARLAYRIREAINSAKVNEVRPYDQLNVVISTGPGSVTIQPKELLVHSSEMSTASFSAKSAFEVVDAATKSNEDLLVFPSWDGTNLKMIQSWARSKDFVVSEDPLTLSREIGERE